MSMAGARKATDHENWSEQQLLPLARQGDENAIRLLIKQNNRRLFRVARAVVLDEAEAEDIVQETYVCAFTRLDAFRGDSQFSTWLVRIALNESFARLRKKRPGADLAELDAAGHGNGGAVIMFPGSLTPPGAEAELARKQVRELLEKAVDDLPRPFRIVFILRDVEGLSVQETSAQLSLKPETVKTRLHRARRLLRKAMEKQLAGSFHELFPFAGVRCERIADQVIERLQAKPEA